jgi:hypothetical protein
MQMTTEYFSDREQGQKSYNSEDITKCVWNGIVSVYESFIANNALAGSFPEICPDGQGIIGCNQYQLQNALKAVLPDIQVPIRCVENSNFSFKTTEIPDKYTILDFVEFLYRHIHDPIKIGRFHDFYNHQHYDVLDKGKFRSEFRNKVNSIFSRNGIVFYLDESGEIKRAVPEFVKHMLSNIKFCTTDLRLNELLDVAYSKFVLPKPNNRIESLEKLWDAFERLKTFFESNKKVSAQTLVEFVSKKKGLFEEYVGREFSELSEIGNKFQIRHFERNKEQLNSDLHIDYLFYRMSSLIHLCIQSLNEVG